MNIFLSFLFVVILLHILIYYYVRVTIKIGTLLKNRENGSIVKVIGIIYYNDKRCYRLNNGEVYDDLDLLSKYTIIS